MKQYMKDELRNRELITENSEVANKEDPWVCYAELHCRPFRIDWVRRRDGEYINRDQAQFFISKPDPLDDMTIREEHWRYDEMFDVIEQSGGWDYVEKAGPA